MDPRKDAKMKFGTKTNSNMQNTMVMLTLPVFDRKDTFLGKFAQKNLNCLLNMKLRI